MRIEIEELIKRYSFFNVFDDIKKDCCKKYIYGAGSLAICLAHRLTEEGIEYEGFIVDEEYFINTNVEGNPVVSFESIDRQQQQYSIVIGMSNYALGNKKHECHPLIHKTYFIIDAPYKDILIKKDVLISYKKEFEETFELLSDEVSINCLYAWIKCSLSGIPDYCYPLALNEQTYYNNDIFTVGYNECLLDIGAYNGDTIKQFVKQCSGKYSQIYGIEGDSDNYRDLVSNLASGGICRNVSLYNAICSDNQNRVVWGGAKNENDGRYLYAANGVLVDADTLDNLLETRNPITIIKMNFPNSVKVLQGGKRILKEDHPKLAIMAGWGGMLAIDLIRNLHEIVPEYRFYLRFVSPMPSKIMLLALVE